MDEESAGPAGLADRTVVDADVHVGVPVEAVADAVDGPLRGLLSRGGGYANDLPFARSSWDPYMGGKIGHHASGIGGAEDLRATLCDEFHIDYPVLNTMTPAYKVSRSDLAVGLMAAYNDHLLDAYLDEVDAFYGLASVATQRPDRAAEELDRLGDEPKVVGAFLVTTGHGASPPLGDPRYDPIYEAAEDNGLAVAFHASAETFGVEFPRQNAGMERFVEVHTAAHLWSQWMTLVSLLVHGAPVKFPDLRFVFLEAGLAWVPHAMYRLNKEVAMRRSEAPLLEESPETYVRRSFRFASQPLGEPDDPDHLRRIVELVGPDLVMFASDYPHWDFDHPAAIGTLVDRAFPAAARDRILAGTAAETFGLPI